SPQRFGRNAETTHDVFVFQAEDGIRDRNVTGVQTCALPISRPPLRLRGLLCCGERSVPDSPPDVCSRWPPASSSSANANAWPSRSEERRVGTERRTEGWLLRKQKRNKHIRTRIVGKHVIDHT